MSPLFKNPLTIGNAKDYAVMARSQDRKRRARGRIRDGGFARIERLRSGNSSIRDGSTRDAGTMGYLARAPERRFDPRAINRSFDRSFLLMALFSPSPPSVDWRAEMRGRLRHTPSVPIITTMS